MSSELPISRRDFIAAAAAGAGIAACATGGRRHGDAGSQLLYVGTYTDPEGANRREGVYLLRLDDRTGALAQAGAFDAGPNPSFLAIHPDGLVLYAVNELVELDGQPTGSVGAFAIDDAGALARLGMARHTKGGAPCYVSVDPTGRAVLVANYVGGNLAVLPVAPDGALAEATQVEPHWGRGPDAERQDAPHAHSVVPDPSGQWALSCDLGADRVLVYALGPWRGRRVALRPNHDGTAVMRPGAGPRHLVFHPALPLVFVANELDNTVATLRWDAARGALSPAGVHATLPAGWSGRSQVADIHLAPSGRTLYVSNRGHDSIAVFTIAADTGALALEQVVPTGGHWPRNFGLDATGRWLLVANERSDSVVVLARDPGSGRLAETAQRLAVPKPVCVRFRAQAGVTT